MNTPELIKHLIDIKTDLAEAKAQIGALDEKMDQHMESAAGTKQDVEELKFFANRAKGAIALIGFLVALVGVLIKLK
jgi:hypothetical protein